MTGILIKREKLGAESMKRKAETWVIHQQAKEYPRFPENEPEPEER